MSIPWLRGLGGRPPLDFFFFVLELFNFEFELHRSAPLAVFERFFLFHVSVDEQVLDFGYPGPFVGHNVLFCFMIRLLRNRSGETVLAIASHS